jgi:hypothetical protein
MNLVTCRYNTNHKMKSVKLLKHEDSCPDKGLKKLLTCPFNPVHLLNPERFEDHKKVCPNKPKIDENIEKEIRDYIESQKKNIETSKSETKKTEKNIIGINKKSKDERGKEQKKMLKLIERLENASVFEFNPNDNDMNELATENDFMNLDSRLENVSRSIIKEEESCIENDFIHLVIRQKEN